MKFDSERLREVVRKRRQEAGEPVQPARRVRRRLRRGPAPAAGGSEQAPAAEEGRTVEAGEQAVETTRARELAAEVTEVQGRPDEAAETPEGPDEAAAVQERPAEAIEAVEVIELDSPAEEAGPDAGPSARVPAEGPTEGGESARVEFGAERAVIVFSPPAWAGLISRLAPVSEAGAAGESAIEGRVAGEPSTPAEKLVPTPAGGEAADTPAESGAAEPEEPATQGQGSHRRTTDKGKKTKRLVGRPTDRPRPAPRYPAMEDARRAEALLSKLRQGDFDAQLKEKTSPELADGVLASMLQLANGFLTLRDRAKRSAATDARTYDRLERLEKEKGELTQEIERRAAEAGQERSVLEADRDAWRSRARDAEGELAREVVRSKAAEAKALAADRGREKFQQINDELRGQLATTGEQVAQSEARAAAAEERANKAWSRCEAVEAHLEAVNKRAGEAEERARRARERAGRAEEGARQAEERATRSDELNKKLNHTVEELTTSAARAAGEAKEAEAARLLAVAQLWDAEARLKEAESQAWAAEAESAERVRKAVADFMQSQAYKDDHEEAAADAYTKGFADCKARMTAVYNLKGTEAIHPGDSDASEASDGDAAEGEASGTEEESASNVPVPGASGAGGEGADGAGES